MDMVLETRVEDDGECLSSATALVDVSECP